MALTNNRESFPKQRVNHILNIAVVGLLAALSAAYIADAAAIRMRQDRFATLHIPRYLAVPLKGGKTEYLDDGVDVQVCAHSLFPQLGHNPCWYAGRTTEERVDE